MPDPVIHFDIGCRDSEESREFYEKMFGWRSQPYGPFSFQLETGAAKGINGFTTALGHEPQNYVMLYVEVESIPEKLSALKTLGGEVVVPETTVPGSGSFAWCKDPSGNLFGLWKSAI